VKLNLETSNGTSAVSACAQEHIFCIAVFSVQMLIYNTLSYRSCLFRTKGGVRKVTKNCLNRFVFIKHFQIT